MTNLAHSAPEPGSEPAETAQPLSREELRKLPIQALLVRAGRLSMDQLSEALRENVMTARPVEEIVVERGWVTAEEVSRLAEAKRMLEADPAEPAPPAVQPEPAPEPEPVPSAAFVAAPPEQAPQPPAAQPVEQTVPLSLVPPEPNGTVAPPLPPVFVPEPPPTSAAEPAQPTPSPSFEELFDELTAQPPVPTVPEAPTAAAPVELPPAYETPPAPTTEPSPPEPFAFSHVAEPEPEPAPDPEPAAEESPAASVVGVVLHLENGERITVGCFRSDDGARRRAEELVDQLSRPGQWPNVGGRFVKPELVLSVELATYALDD